MKFEYSITGSAMRAGFLAPTSPRGKGGLRPDTGLGMGVQPTRRRFVDEVASGSVNAVGVTASRVSTLIATGTTSGTTTPGPSTSAPPIT